MSPIDSLLEVGIDVPAKIQSIYNDCNDEEKQILIDILTELSQYGESETYKNLWLEDYKEIPVDLDTFLCNDRYLGKVTRNGEGIYPYWKTAMHQIFDAGNKYHECLFTGATRIGKSSTGITCAAYMLYRLMCLRDPQKFFNKKGESKFSLLFFNVTKELAQSVAYREFNDTLAASPWFMEHGTLSKSERNFYYIPEGGKIVIEAGSDVAHSLGKQIFCLVGSTKVVTSRGPMRLDEMYEQQDPGLMVYCFGKELHCKPFHEVVLIKFVHDTVALQLEDSTIIEGTPEHLILHCSGIYKRLDAFNINDRLFSPNSIRGIKIRAIHKVHYHEPIPVYDIQDVEYYHNFLIYGNSCNLVSHNCGFMDEINFAKSGIKDINKAKANIKATYDSIVARVEGTFRQNGEVWGKIFAVSSKKGDSDFMEDHIQQQMTAGNEHMIVFDKPQWEVLPPGQFNPEKFYIAIGDRHHRGFVVENDSEQALAELKEQGYQLMQVPLDMKTNFLADFDISLRDLAGIAVPGALSFISQDILDTNIVQDRQNPFLNEILEIGTKDSYTIEEFFHLELVPKYIKNMDLFIHLDLSLNDDKSGISGSGIVDRKDIVQDNGKTVSMPVFAHAFSVDIKAPRGDKIPYAKITNFIVWLRSQGFNIELISRDQFQSEYMAQLLEAQGFRTEKISLDRTPDGYMALRSILLEQRVQMLDVKLLQDELIYLQRDSLTGKVDHMVGRCFTGDTMIKLAFGGSKSILDLLIDYKSGVTNYLYSYDRLTGEIIRQRIRKVFQTMITTELVEVVLDDGEKVRCTSNHKFMMADGSYKRIKDINPNEDLMRMNLIKGIRSVTKIKVEPTPVYDIEMDIIPNFALQSGIFVHNSKDMADSFAGSIWCAMLHGDGAPVSRTNVMKAITSVNGPRSSIPRDARNLPSMFPGLNFNPGSRGRR